LPLANRRTRGRIALALLLVVIILGASLLFWRQATPPLVARILPEAQGILYFNLSPLRAATHFDRKPVQHDLNQAAFALDPLPDATGPNGGLAFSEVFAGNFDAVRLARYLAGIAVSTENYDGRTIYSIPNDGRTVRVAILPHGIVAISNTPTPEQIHSMLDRDRTAWLPFGSAQPTLLSEHYRDLPVLSLAWGLGQIGLPFGDHGEFRVFGFSLPIRLDATFVASLRWTGALQLRIEEIAPNETAATASAQALSGVLGIARLATNTLPDQITSQNLRTVLNSAKVTAYSDRAVLNATLPDNVLQALVHTSDGLTPTSH
jgi:hypothetical protein